MAELKATIAAAAELKATIGAGKINVNDYVLTVEEIEGGCRVKIVRGSQTQEVIIPDYSADEAARAAAEASRVTAENARLSAEESRQSAESSRVAAEKERESSEKERASAELVRASAETSRQSAETARESAESSRVSAEKEREGADEARDEAELDRQSAEVERADAEKARAAAESARASAESTRASAETARASAESDRAAAETTRQSNETARQSAESKRETDSSTATQAANTAATNAQNIADTVQAKLDAGDFKGEKGDPGSDAEVTKANIESALGSLPKPNGNFELLHDITVSETGLSSIAINENITALAIIFTTSTTENNNITAGFVTSQNRGFNVYFSDGYAIQFIYTNIVNAQPIGLWARKASASEYTPLEMQFIPISQCRSINWPITHFTKCTVTTGRTDGFAIGTKLQIYGVRA